MDVFVFMNRQVELKREAGKESTADLYRATCNRLQRFLQRPTLRFEEITSAMVDQFGEWMMQEGRPVNTVNTYLSNFRTLYNKAVRAGLCLPDVQPFSHLQLKRDVTVKRAVPVQVLERAVKLKPKVDAEMGRSIDWFIFCFMACGMAFVDLAHLTWQNVRGNELVYKRKKTGALIRIGITPGMKLIINRYARKGSRYLFPILPEKGTSHEGYKAILARHNACLRMVSELLHLSVTLTSYVARHTWATEALRNNTPVAVIKQAMGHLYEETTVIYLALLSRKTMNKANRKITRLVDDLVVMEG